MGTIINKDMLTEKEKRMLRRELLEYDIIKVLKTLNSDNTITLACYSQIGKSLYVHMSFVSSSQTFFQGLQFNKMYDIDELELNNN